VLNIISGFEASDEKTAWCDREKQLSYLPRVDAGLTGKRIGVLQKFFGKDAEHEEVNGIVLSRIDLMRSLGAEIIDLHDQVDSDYLTTQVSVHLYDCNEDLNAYLQAQDRQLPVRSLQEIVESGRYHPSLDANFRKALTLSKSSQEYKDHIMRRFVVRDQVMQIMASNSLDAVVYPHQKRLVVPIGQTQIERNGVLAAVTGFPSVAIPAGFSAPSIQAPIGVPVGLELLGRPWSEALLLEIAYVIEQNASVRKNPLSAPSLHN
jgi:Asp-tRNA(Asn)/Glu-tRNA(Gln) amidotransferase A subunit family amidase